ncbi:hypothetical protein RFI_31177, partial [Reticulomyxa filosa]
NKSKNKSKSKNKQKDTREGNDEDIDGDKTCNPILVLNQCPAGMVDQSKLVPGESLVELGRKSLQELRPYGVTERNAESILDVYERYVAESRQVLSGLERKDPQWHVLWKKTRQWSVDEFHDIYKWFGARFDHDFCESECSEESRKLVTEYYDKGVLEMSEGAVGCRLDDQGLGFCMLLKSDGSSLYATKDLVLAKRKFDQYKVDYSIYVVDAAQSLHFKQVFAVLKKMGYSQAEKCFHLPYGLVILSSGKMSTRMGNVILFQQLKQLLCDEINAKFFDRLKATGKLFSSDHEDDVSSLDDTSLESKKKLSCKKKSRAVEQQPWSEQELKDAERAISVGCIRYGMLNHDTNKDIVFDLQKWTLSTGDTGIRIYVCCKVLFFKMIWSETLRK